MKNTPALRVVLFGYGRMGRAVECAARRRGHRVVQRIDPSEGHPVDTLEPADVAIDFTRGSTVLQNVRSAARAGVNVVVGTTGWDADLAAASTAVESASIGMLHAPNFAIGIHVFRRIVEEAVALFDRVGGYDASLTETHHRHKIDSPSGTALHLAEAVLARMKAKRSWTAAPPDGAADPETLYIASRRTGEVPGTHTVEFDGPLDRVELRHEVRDRSVFADGAVQAAEWLHGRTGVYTLDDLFRAGS